LQPEKAPKASILSIAFSGHSADAQAGMDAVLDRPIEISTLVSTITRLGRS
jgi:hypothetical protein